MPDLISYLEATGETTLTTRLALEWATQPVGHPQECTVRLSIARGIARYLQTIDGRTEVPPTNLLPRCQHRPTPYLYSDAEIAAVIAATDMLRCTLIRATYQTLIGLLAVSGMRVGETIGLDRADLDLAPSCVTVRGGKPGARHELPLHDSTLRALPEYCHVREEHWPHPTSPAFLSAAGTRLLHANISRTFRGLPSEAGLSPQAGSDSRPRIHSLRHYADGGVMRPVEPFGLVGALRVVILSA